VTCSRARSFEKVLRNSSMCFISTPADREITCGKKYVPPSFLIHPVVVDSVQFATSFLFPWPTGRRQRGCCSAITSPWWRLTTAATSRACVLLRAAALLPAAWPARRSPPVPPAAEQELLAWAFAVLTCSWPELPGAVVPGARRERFTRVAVLADPQLTDMTSYRAASSGPLLLVRSVCAPRGARCAAPADAPTPRACMLCVAVHGASRAPRGWRCCRWHSLLIERCSPAKRIFCHGHGPVRTLHAPTGPRANPVPPQAVELVCNASGEAQTLKPKP